MKKKIRKQPSQDKVEEVQAAYGAGSEVETGASIRYSDPKKVRKTNAELMKVHQEVLRKLAQ